MSENTLNRRALMGAATIAAAALAAPAVRAGGHAKRPIVLVHGAWHGAWAWARLIPLLTAEGRSVTAVNLSGLGENHHRQAPEVGLHAHVADVTNHLFMNDIKDAVVVGHSYGGCVLSGALAKDDEGRIAQAIYLDALVPDEGQSLSTFVPEDVRAGMIKGAEAGAMAPPRPREALGKIWGLEGDLVDFAVPRLKPMSLRCFTEAVEGSMWRDGVQYDYLRCKGNPNPLFERIGEEKKADARFRYTETDGHHDVMLIDPPKMAAALFAIL